MAWQRACLCRSIETYVKVGNHIGKARGSTADVEQAEVPKTVDKALAHPAMERRFLSMRRSQVVHEAAHDGFETESSGPEAEVVPPAAVPAADRGQVGACKLGSEALTASQQLGNEQHWGLLRDSVIKDKRFLKDLKDD